MTVGGKDAVRCAVAALRSAASSNAPDAMMLLGAGLVAYGAWCVYPPAGYITGGVLLIVAGVIASRSAA